MPTALYSIVLDAPADEVWAVIRLFDHYGWAGVPGVTVIEAGKAGDQVGAVRRFTSGDRVLRQVLLAHSDAERSYTYAFCDTPPFPVADYIATIRVTPVVADNRAFVEWSARFDCALDERQRWIDHFERQGFAVWLASLRRFIAARRAG